MNAMNHAPKRQRRRVGDFVEIDLANGYRTYARVLEDASFAFYDARSKRNLAISEVASRAILFIVAVMDYAVKRGRWKIVGNAPLEKELSKNPPKFIQDSIDPRQFSIYENGEIRPATRAECVGLECAAVWDPGHVEDRLRDHYAGKPNAWLRQLGMT